MTKREFFCRAAIQALPECIKLVAASTAYFGQDGEISSEERAAGMAKEYAHALTERLDNSVIDYFDEK